MWNLLLQARKRFAQDQRGNIAVIFCFAAVPMIGLLGGAVDVTRQHRYKLEIQNAVDAAAIALVRSGITSNADADAYVNRYVATMMPGRGRDAMLHMQPFDAITVDGGFRVVGNGVMDTAFLPVVGIQELPLQIETQVQATGGNYEIALALDNTGSMAEHNKIGALKIAANHLIDTMFEKDGAEDRVKMALVPFTTTVNIRGDAFKPSWLDPNGAGLGAHRLDSYDRDVSRLDIFKALSNGRVGADGLPAAWKGCVEAREGDHDIDDVSPDSSDATTRWTPYLSPDGADSGRGWESDNSYLSDQTGGRGSARDRLRNVDKYFNPIVTASFNDTSGPNQSCRGPIVELTNNEQRMRDAITAMQPGGYTHIPQGLAWGWRVLSPDEPFDQGVSYDDTTTQKVLVLLSDGKNTFPETYTSYGYRADGRLASSENAGVRKLNDKVASLCEAVKAKGIRLYSILLEENDPQTTQIFKNCASPSPEGGTLYYEVPDARSLTAAFDDIGKDLSTLRITR